MIRHNYQSGITMDRAPTKPLAMIVKSSFSVYSCPSLYSNIRFPFLWLFRFYLHYIFQSIGIYIDSMHVFSSQEKKNLLCDFALKKGESFSPGNIFLLFLLKFWIISWFNIILISITHYDTIKKIKYITIVLTLL